MLEKIDAPTGVRIFWGQRTAVLSGDNPRARGHHPCHRRDSASPDRQTQSPWGDLVRPAHRHRAGCGDGRCPVLTSRAYCLCGAGDCDHPVAELADGKAADRVGPLPHPHRGTAAAAESGRTRVAGGTRCRGLAQGRAVFAAVRAAPRKYWPDPHRCSRIVPRPGMAEVAEG